MSWRSAIAAVLLCAALPLAASPPPEPQWYAVRTTNLTGFAQGNERAAREAARRGEELIAAFSEIFHRRQIHFSTPLCILASAPAGAPALRQTPVCNYVSGEAERPESWAAAARALATLLLDENYPRAQPWFDRGVAAYLAGTRRAAEQSELGAPPPGMELPTAGAWIPLPRLFAATGAQPETASPAFEAESFVVVRWIISNGRQAQAGAYLEAVEARGFAPEQAASDSFRMSLADLDREVRESLGKPALIRIPAPQIDERVFTARKLTAGDVFVLRANLTLFGAEAEGTLNSLVDFARQNEDATAAHRSLGWAFLQRGDLDNAIEHIRRALALDDSSPQMHYLYAVQVNHGERDHIRIASADARLGTELKTALRLDPNYAPAWELLGLAQLSVNSVQPALESLRRGSALAPRCQRCYLNLAQAELEAGNRQAARNLLLYAKAGNDAAVAGEASTALEEMTRERKQRERWGEMGLSAPAAKPGKYDNIEEAIAEDERHDAAEKGAQTGTSAGAETRSILHLRGHLLSVQCANSGAAATLSVSSAGNQWTLRVADRGSLPLIGADAFDCNWRDREVSVNYRARGKLGGDVVSLETH